MDIFKSLNEEGATIILVTHESDIADQANRIVTFRDGQIISDIRTKEF
jgi:putative ABC transport system ATP-binding protein